MSTDSSRSAAEDSLEDYALRFVPRSFRRWGSAAVASSALGSIAFLADFSIGASGAIQYGTLNAIVGILSASLIIFAVGFPLAHYAARYNIDLDLITRGSGFGYYGSVISNIIFASFTFIFFALEGAIMAQGLYVAVGLPKPIGYVLSTIVVIPIVIYGMKALERLQNWTTPLWLVLALVPVGFLLAADPASFTRFLDFQGAAAQGTTVQDATGMRPFDLRGIALTAGVCFALIPQIAEQIDYLRSMPRRSEERAASWWAALILAGPGWVVFSAIKQIIGAFLAIYFLSTVAEGSAVDATQPVHQFLAVYRSLMPNWLAILLVLILILLAQIKINVTNAYSGSLAWSNVATRLTRSYPGRAVFVVANLLIALVLMELNLFDFLGSVLGFFANLAMSWLVTVAADIVINKKFLRISPTYPESRRGMLFGWNPVGVTSLVLASGLSILTFFGAFGHELEPFSVVVAVVVAVVVTPAMAILTKGRWYLRRISDGIDLPLLDEEGNPSGERLRCHVTGYLFERPDMLLSAERGPNGEKQYISSLALALDKTGRYLLPPD